MSIEWDKIVDFNKVKSDENGILLTNSIYKDEVLRSKSVWETI